MTSKHCKKCGRDLPLNLFTVDRGKKDGLKTCCKECCRVAYKSWRDSNKKHLSEYMRAYRKRSRK